MANKFEEIRRKAFNAFLKVAAKEKANGAETLEIFRLVPQFSSAPKQDTDDMMIGMRYWSRKGDGEALARFGEDLYNWAADNDYAAKPHVS